MPHKASPTADPTANAPTVQRSVLSQLGNTLMPWLVPHVNVAPNQNYGTHPDDVRPSFKGSPIAHYRSDAEGDYHDFGFSGMHQKTKSGDVLDMFTLSGQQGYADDWWGQALSGGVMKLGINKDEEDDGFSGEVGVGTFGYDASVSDSTASLGLQANLAEVAATYSNLGSAETGRLWRFGLSEGIGGAGRVHYGDKDNDGWREYGFGFDAGMVSFDYKTEDILGDMLRVNPLTLGLMNTLGTDTNVTRGLYNAGSAVYDAGASVASTVGEYGGYAVDAIGSGLATVGGGIADMASSAWDMMNGDWSLW